MKQITLRIKLIALALLFTVTAVIGPGGRMIAAGEEEAPAAAELEALPDPQATRPRIMTSESRIARAFFILGFLLFFISRATLLKFSL